MGCGVKILVTVKRVPDPECKLKVDQGVLDSAHFRWQINPFDEYALEAALRLTEDPARPGVRLGEVVVVGIGCADLHVQLRAALAMGADRAVHLHADEERLDALRVVRALRQIVSDEKPDLVFIGKLSADGEGGGVGPMLAGMLGWPQATFASGLDLHSTEGTCRVFRALDKGFEEKTVRLPAVITVNLCIVAPHAVRRGTIPPALEYRDGVRSPTVKGIRDARNKPLAVLSLDVLQGSDLPTVRTVSVELVPARKPGVRVESAAALVDKLRHEAKVL